MLLELYIDYFHFDIQSRAGFVFFVPLSSSLPPFSFLRSYFSIFICLQCPYLRYIRKVKKKMFHQYTIFRCFTCTSKSRSSYVYLNTSAFLQIAKITFYHGSSWVPLLGVALRVVMKHKRAPCELFSCFLS